MRNFSFSARFGWMFLAGIATGVMPGSPVQAQPNTLSYNYQEGNFLAEAEINPLAGRLLGRVLKKEIPSAVTFSATELAGSFTIPDTTTTVGNGSITLDSGPVKAFLEPYLQQAMGKVAQSYSLPEEVGIETLESVMNYRFIGQGLLKSANDSTAFTFEYGDDIDRLSIQGIDPDVLALCQVQECNTQLDGDFDLKLDVEGFSETSEDLGIKLPSSVKRALRRAQLFGFREVAFADGKLTSVVQVLPNLEPPVGEEGVSPSLPDIAVPEIAVPEVAVPEIVVPEVTIPGVTIPGGTIPEVTAPEVTVPEVSVPGTTQPVDSDAPVSEEAISTASMPVLLQSQLSSLRAIATPSFPRSLHQLTHGKFVLSAERMTAPWSMVFAVPSR